MNRAELWFQNLFVVAFAVFMASSMAMTEPSPLRGFYMKTWVAGLLGIVGVMVGSFIAEEKGWM